MGPYNFWESMYSEKTMTILSIIDENEKGKELQKFIIIMFIVLVSATDKGGVQ